MFERFYRVLGATPPGSGLGLADRRRNRRTASGPDRVAVGTDAGHGCLFRRFPRPRRRRGARPTVDAPRQPAIPMSTRRPPHARCPDRRDRRRLLAPESAADVGLLAVWFAVTFVRSWFAVELNQIDFIGPLGYLHGRAGRADHLCGDRLVLRPAHERRWTRSIGTRQGGATDGARHRQTQPSSDSCGATTSSTPVGFVAFVGVDRHAGDDRRPAENCSATCSCSRPSCSTPASASCRRPPTCPSTTSPDVACRPCSTAWRRRRTGCRPPASSAWREPSISSGHDGLAFIMGWTGGYCLVALFLAPYLRRFGQYTIPDFLGARYGGNIPRLIGVFAAVLCSFTYVIAQIYGVGIITSRFTGLEFTIGVFVGLAGILVCSFLGGMKAVTWTQVAQYIILIVAYMIPVVWLSVKHTGSPVPADLRLHHRAAQSDRTGKGIQRQGHRPKANGKSRYAPILRQRVADLDADLAALETGGAAFLVAEKKRRAAEVARLKADPEASPRAIRAAEQGLARCSDRSGRGPGALESRAAEAEARARPGQAACRALRRNGRGRVARRRRRTSSPWCSA